jgi:hypothetical protein
MSCTLKKADPKPCNIANPGGVADIYAIPQHDIANWGTIVDGKISTGMTLVATKVFTQIPFNKKTAKVTQGFKGDDPNFMNCTHGIELDIPFLTGKNNDAISSMIGVELIAFAQLNTGLWFMLGDEKNGIFLTGGEGTSGEQGGKNTQGLKLIGEYFAKLPIEIDAVFVKTLIP